MTNTEDYQPQGTDISVDHCFDFRHFGVLSTACFRAPPGYIYSALPPHIQTLFGIRSLPDSELYHSNLPLGCESTSAPLERISTKMLASYHGRAFRTEGLGLQGQHAREQIRQIRHTD